MRRGRRNVGYMSELEEARLPHKLEELASCPAEDIVRALRRDHRRVAKLGGYFHRNWSAQDWSGVCACRWRVFWAINIVLLKKGVVLGVRPIFFFEDLSENMNKTSPAPCVNSFTKLLESQNRGAFF